MADQEDWTPGDVASMVANPFYAVNRLAKPELLPVGKPRLHPGPADSPPERKASLCDVK